MVHIKSKRELEIMRQAGRMVARILFELADKAEEGITLLELNDHAEKRTLELGAKPAFKGYHGYRHALCTSVNEQIVHGIPSKRTLKNGDIVGLDFGLVFDGFYSDSAITVGIGETKPEAKKLMQATKDSLYAAIDASRNGNTLRDIALAVERIVNPFQYGIVREFVGHGIGTKLHEEPQIPNYSAGASPLKLKAGMTIAIEPMITAGDFRVKVLADKWTAVTQDGSLSAHYEHTIAINEGEPEILTSWEPILMDLDKPLGEKAYYGQRGPNPS